MNDKFDEAAYEAAIEKGGSHEEAVAAAHGEEYKAKKKKPKKVADK